MACVTLKRPLEWIDPSMSPESGSSSPTHMITSNSPPHHGLRSPKRLCLQSISQSSSNGFSQYSSTPTTCHYSPLVNYSSFNNNNTYYKPISSSEIADQIREEMLRLRIIRRKKVARLFENNANSSSSSKTLETSMSLSPQRQDGGNTSDEDETNKQSSTNATLSSYNFYTNLLANLHSTTSDHQNLSSNNKKCTIDNNSASNNKSSTSQTALNSLLQNNDKPLFTFNQVVMIVERILKAKEESIKQEFQQVLTQRLSEQYDQFVKFSHDQLLRRFDSQALPSYLS